MRDVMYRLTQLLISFVCQNTTANMVALCCMHKHTWTNKPAAATPYAADTSTTTNTATHAHAAAIKPLCHSAARTTVRLEDDFSVYLSSQPSSHPSIAKPQTQSDHRKLTATFSHTSMRGCTKVYTYPNMHPPEQQHKATTQRDYAVWNTPNQDGIRSQAWAMYAHSATSSQEQNT